MPRNPRPDQIGTGGRILSEYAPALPERPAIVAGGAQGFVPGRCRRAVLFPKSAVLTDRNDRGCLSGDDSGVATAGVIGAIHCPAGSCEAWSREGARSRCQSLRLPGSGPIGPAERAGRMGLSPSLLGVNSTARMSEVAVSMARWTFRPLSAMLASPAGQ